MDPTQWLDLDGGRCCLPRFMKAHLMDVIEAKYAEDPAPDRPVFREWLQGYYGKRLAFIARSIESRAADEAAGGHRFFAGLCRELANASCVLAARWPIADVEAATFITVVWQRLVGRFSCASTASRPATVPRVTS